MNLLIDIFFNDEGCQPTDLLPHSVELRQAFADTIRVSLNDVAILRFTSAPSGTLVLFLYPTNQATDETLEENRIILQAEYFGRLSQNPQLLACLGEEEIYHILLTQMSVPLSSQYVSTFANAFMEASNSPSASCSAVYGLSEDPNKVLVEIKYVVSDESTAAMADANVFYDRVMEIINAAGIDWICTDADPFYVNEVSLKKLKNL